MARAFALVVALAAPLLFAACANAAPDCGSIPGCTACEEVGAAALDRSSLAPTGELDSAQAGRRLLKRSRGAEARWKAAGPQQDAGKPRGLLGASADGLQLLFVDAADNGRHLLGRAYRGRGGGSSKAARAPDAGKPRGLLEALADGLQLPSVGAADTGRHLLNKSGGHAPWKAAGSQNTAEKPRGQVEAYVGATAVPRLVCTACGAPGYQLDASAGICGEEQVPGSCRLAVVSWGLAESKLPLWTQRC